MAAVKFLGQIVTADEIGVDPITLALFKIGRNRNAFGKCARCFGLALYYRRFIENFGKITTPLTKMLENNRIIAWDDDDKTAFS